ncbi:glycosyltransferase family 39 protein, partial [Candidatus Sumerlaeota bacterium]|nr:glycosyltransferase family 39 protein [Candidatus Sumerlaeota bacterium]
MESPVSTQGIETETGGRRVVRAGMILVLAATAAFLGWRSINHVTPRLDRSAAVFAAAGLHLAHGRILYEEVWDHKPPVIHAINALAFKAGGTSCRSIRNVERWMLALAAVSFFFVVWRTFGDPLLALLGSFLFLLHFVHPSSFRSGNLTEEYGGVFILVGVAAAVAARERKRPSAALWLCGISGMTFSLAVLTKEPFCLSALAWSLFLLAPRTQGRRRTNLKVGACFVGALAPLAACVFYLTSHGALDDWIDVLHFNLVYKGLAGGSSQSFFARFHDNLAPTHYFLLDHTVSSRLGFLAGLVAMTRLSFLRRYRFFPLFAGAAFLLDYIATFISQSHQPHYYLIPVPSYVLVVCCGWAFLLDLARDRRLLRSGMFLSLVVSALFLDYGSYGRILTEHRELRETESGSWVVGVRFHSKRG